MNSTNNPVIADPAVSDFQPVNGASGNTAVNTLNANAVPSIEGVASPSAGGIIPNEFAQNPNGDGHFVAYELPLFPNQE